MPHRFYALTVCVALLLHFGIARAADATYEEAFAAATVLSQAGDYAGAQKQLEEFLPYAKTSKQTITTLTGIAQALAGQKLYPQAREQLEKILLLPGATEQDEAEAHLRMGAYYNDEKNDEAARAQFEMILQLPNVEINTRAVAHLSLYAVYSNTKQYEKAYKEVYSVLNDPQFPNNTRAKIALNAGDSELKNQNFEKAREFYGEVDNINGVPVAFQLSTLLKVAESYLKEKKTAEASTVYEKAFRYGFDEGAKLFEGDKFEESIAVMKLCLDIPRLPTPLKTGPLYYIGASLMELKEGVRAATVLRMASIEPTAAELAKTGPLDTRSFRSFQTSARVRVIRLYAGSPNKENQAVAVTLINELLQDPNADLNDNRRAQLRQTLKSLPQPTP